MRRVLMGLAVVVGLLAGGCGGDAPRAAEPSTVSTTAASARHAAGDVAFARELIAHHRAGIALASAVAAKYPQARTLAEAIIVTQQDEVVRMTGWLREWGAAPPPSAAPVVPAGDPLRALVAHQDEAIRLAQREQSDGTNPAALAFAKQVVESRAAQIEQLEGFLS